MYSSNVFFFCFLFFLLHCSSFFHYFHIYIYFFCFIPLYYTCVLLFVCSLNNIFIDYFEITLFQNYIAHEIKVRNEVKCYDVSIIIAGYVIAIVCRGELLGILLCKLKSKKSTYRSCLSCPPFQQKLFIIQNLRAL